MSRTWISAPSARYRALRSEHHTVPWAVATASYKRQRRNPGVTEIAEVKGRGHSSTIDHCWREVADTALAFVERFVNA